VFSIGHSNRTAEEFLALLQAHGVRQVADVRRFPMSRRLPHFNSEALAAFLQQHGIGYRHFEALGGRRRPRADSINGAWQHESFRGYADYLGTREFEAALAELLRYADGGPGADAGAGVGVRATAVMCAEALWWQCHRRLIADVLVARQVQVLHIMTGDRAEAHHLTPFAVVSGTSVTYPGLLDQPLAD
jgi:uncharacterized protein (DUF488 family)